ncbi:Six-hairpin glycosidase-like protein [Scheffersomyces coipomensis]|uniref:Six-hairpin glycosidase-like protein n=1 Tax=Scheffersomyces coipomensis TaxID=1788519 RepID=UPI00315CB1B0
MLFSRLLLSLSPLIALSSSQPIGKRDGTITSESAYSSALGTTWSNFWNPAQNAWNLNDQICPGYGYSSPVVWNVAVASKVIIDSGNAQQIQLVVNDILQYQNSAGYFSATTARDDDVYLDDDSQVMWVLIGAYQALGNQAYLTAAQTLMNNIMSQWNPTVGGVNEHVNADYVASISTLEAALAAVKLYEVSPNQDLVTFAENCITWISKTLQDPNDHLIYDGIAPSTGQINDGKLTYTVGVMISTLAYLNKITGQSSYIDQAIVLGNAATNAQGAFYTPQGFWNNELQYVEFLFAGFADLLNIGTATTSTQQAAFSSYTTEVYQQATYLFNFFQVGTSGAYVDDVFTASQDIFTKYTTAFPNSGTFATDASNFCGGTLGGTVQTSLLTQASATEIFYQLSRIT